MADLHHLARGVSRRRAAQLLEQFDLTEAGRKPASSYSGCMRRRLDLAMTLVGSPRVIFLDEPTVGLDPRSRRSMWQIIRDLVASGVTIYAASQRYRDHDAFRETVEVSVALHAGYRSQGVGSALYRALFDRLAGEPVHVAVAAIAMPNDASVALHRKFGFTEVGTFREYAVKNGRYISSFWMQRLAPSGGTADRLDHQ
jgi:L-amino acid N-acyltransferase YncA